MGPIVSVRAQPLRPALGPPFQQALPPQVQRGLTAAIRALLLALVPLWGQTWGVLLPVPPRLRVYQTSYPHLAAFAGISFERKLVLAFGWGVRPVNNWAKKSMPSAHLLLGFTLASICPLLLAVPNSWGS